MRSRRLLGRERPRVPVPCLVENCQREHPGTQAVGEVEIEVRPGRGGEAYLVLVVGIDQPGPVAPLVPAGELPLPAVDLDDADGIFAVAGGRDAVPVVRAARVGRVPRPEHRERGLAAGRFDRERAETRRTVPRKQGNVGVEVLAKGEAERQIDVPDHCLRDRHIVASRIQAKGNVVLVVGAALRLLRLLRLLGLLGACERVRDLELLEDGALLGFFALEGLDRSLGHQGALAEPHAVGAANGEYGSRAVRGRERLRARRRRQTHCDERVRERLFAGPLACFHLQVGRILRRLKPLAPVAAYRVDLPLERLERRRERDRARPHVVALGVPEPGELEREFPAGRAVHYPKRRFPASV